MERRKYYLVLACTTVVAAVLLYWTIEPDSDAQLDARHDSRQLVETTSKDSVTDRPTPHTSDDTNPPAIANAGRGVPTLGGVSHGLSTATDQKIGPTDSARQPIAERAKVEEAQDERSSTFILSDAIRGTCEKYANDLEANCSGQQAVLAKFSQEPRDSAWAIARESEIRAAVAAVAGYRIRVAECRTTVCVLEVESNIGGFRSNNLRSIKAELELVDLINGYERKSAAQLTTATLATFRRKS